MRTILSNAVGHDVRRAANDQFARAFDAPWTPALRKLQQHQHLAGNALVHGHRGARIVLLDEVEDSFSVIHRQW